MDQDAFEAHPFPDDILASDGGNRTVECAIAPTTILPQGLPGSQGIEDEQGVSRRDMMLLGWIRRKHRQSRDKRGIYGNTTQLSFDAALNPMPKTRFPG